MMRRWWADVAYTVLFLRHGAGYAFNPRDLAPPSARRPVITHIVPQRSTSNDDVCHFRVYGYADDGRELA